MVVTSVTTGLANVGSILSGFKKGFRLGSLED